jgi:hypothetical protein
LGAREGLGFTDSMRFHGRNFVAPWNDVRGVMLGKQNACHVEIEKTGNVFSGS